MKKFVFFNGKVSKIGLIMFLVMGVFLCVNYIFCFPSKVNSFIASKIYETPANSAFVDDNFYQCVVDAYNVENNSNVAYTEMLLDEQLSTIKNLTCWNENVDNVAGIEKLVSLENLTVPYNQIEELDVSNNKKIVSLRAFNNQIKKLNISNNTLLTELDVRNNCIKELNFNNNVALVEVDVFNNYLEELDFSNNIALKYLTASRNLLTKLNISNNTLLSNVYIDINQLSELNVSNNLELFSLDVSNNYLKELNVSNNTELVFLEVWNNQLTDIDVSNNTILTNLDVSDNEINEIDVSNNTWLTWLDLRNNQLTDIDLSNNNLSNLYISNNQLTDVDISSNTRLTEVKLENNQLNKLDVSNNKDLYNLYISNNQITKLDLSENKNLHNLYVSNNKLTELDLCGNTYLNELVINGNPFKNELYVYKNDVVVVNNVKLPSHFEWDGPIWTSSDTDIATVGANGTVTTISKGKVEIIGVVSDKYTTTSVINVIGISSDKYVINDKDNFIFISNDNCDEEILNNINATDENISLELDKDNYVLYVKHDEDILKEFKLVSFSSDIEIIDNNMYVGNLSDEKILSQIVVINGSYYIEDNKLKIKYEDIVLAEINLLGVDFGNLKEFNKKINLLEDIIYSDFISNIVVSKKLTFKVFKGIQEIVSGNIEKDMILKIYYDEKEIDSYIIDVIDEYFEISDDIIVDDENSCINNIDFNTDVDKILSKIDTTGEVIVKDKDNNVITGSSKIGTGSVIMIKLSEETYNYTVVIRGDVDGDGALRLSDIMKIANYTYRDKSSLTGAFATAADFDNSGTPNLQDIMKSAKVLYGGE